MFHRHVTSLMSKFCHLTSQFQTKKRQKPCSAGISFRSAWEPSWFVTGDWQATQPAAVIQKGLSPKSWLEFLSRFWPLVCGLGLALFVGRFWQSIIFLHSSFQTGKIFLNSDWQVIDYVSCLIQVPNFTVVNVMCASFSIFLGQVQEIMMVADEPERTSVRATPIPECLKMFLSHTVFLLSNCWDSSEANKTQGFHPNVVVPCLATPWLQTAWFGSPKKTRWKGWKKDIWYVKVRKSFLSTFFLTFNSLFHV